jgi:hypothetical protein
MGPTTEQVREFSSNSSTAAHMMCTAVPCQNSVLTSCSLLALKPRHFCQAFGTLLQEGLPYGVLPTCAILSLVAHADIPCVWCIRKRGFAW